MMKILFIITLLIEVALVYAFATFLKNPAMQDELQKASIPMMGENPTAEDRKHWEEVRKAANNGGLKRNMIIFLFGAVNTLCLLWSLRNLEQNRRARLAASAGAALLMFSGNVMAAEAPDYSAVDTLFTKHCLDCHADKDAEKGLLLDSHEGVMKGGESGTAIVPGNSSESLLVKFLEGRSGKTGKNQFMPPGKAEKLKPAEITLVRAWIDAGAKPPKESAVVARELSVPKIEPKVAPRRSIKSLAYASTPALLAVARYGEIELRSVKNGSVVRTLSGMHGTVNAVAFSPDGKWVFAAGGLAGVSGEVRQWSVADGSPAHSFEGHRDAVYALAVSPDGRTVATGGYDQKIRLWSTESGKEIRMLSGHNGCVYAVAFRPDGKILASASADRTVKLWDVASGERRDTLTQPLKEIYTVAFSPDGKRLAAGGVDNRIRVWQVSEKAAETTNPLLFSRFGHEGAILRVAFSADGGSLVSSADDRTVKLWEAAGMKERLLLEKQSDWAPGVAFLNGGTSVAVGRMDGTITIYDATSGKVVLAENSGSVANSSVNVAVRNQ